MTKKTKRLPDLLMRAAVTALTDRVKRLEARLDTLESGKSEQAIPLVDILRSFPGGMGALSKASKRHPDTLYKFANGTKPIRFSVQTAQAVAAAFRRRRAVAFEQDVTVARLREAWERERGRRIIVNVKPKEKRP